MLCHLFMERLHFLPIIQICAFLATLNSINYITLFMPQCVGRFNVTWDMIFIKDLPEFLRCSCAIGNDDVVTFSLLLLSVCSGSYTSFDKGPVWIATDFECSPDVLLFLLLPL